MEQQPACMQSKELCELYLSERETEEILDEYEAQENFEWLEQQYLDLRRQRQKRKPAPLLHWDKHFFVRVSYNSSGSKMAHDVSCSNRNPEVAKWTTEHDELLILANNYFGLNKVHKFLEFVPAFQPWTAS